jgi:formylglycine-generating enzyme required for sulfatase activity
MRTVLKFLLCNLIAFGFVSGAYGLTIPASEDSVGYLNKLTAGANAAPNLMVDANHTAFLYFNLDEVPQDAVLRWAKLRLFLPSVRLKGAGLGVHVVTSQWDEAAASNQPTVATGTVAGIGPEKLGTRRFVTVDVTSTVQSWISGGTVNEGFAIKSISGGTAVSLLYLTSKDGASLGLPAELDLDFKPAVEAPASVSVEQLPSSVRALLTPSGITEEQPPSSVRTLLIPKITTQAGILSDSPSIGAVVEGVGPFTYQWYKNGVAVTGGTGSTLSLIGLTSGTYTLSASNGFATVTSSAVPFIPPSLSFDLAPISGGTYTIGNVIGDADITDNPVRSVTLSPYSMAVNDTTKAQWDTVRTWALTHGYTDLASGAGKAANHPVQTVTWYDVVKWANAASEKDGLTPCYSVSGAVYRTGQVDAVICDWSANGYRLPTEAEWEVAARGGLTGKRFPWGDTISQSQANYYAYNGVSYDLSGSVNGFNPTYAAGDYPYTSPVGSFAANGYGLYDMAGNVWQWCWDWYGTPDSGGGDPRGSATGSYRVLRGGIWSYYASDARSAYRRYITPTAAYNDFGFRLARGRP